MKLTCEGSRKGNQKDNQIREKERKPVCVCTPEDHIKKWSESERDISPYNSQSSSSDTGRVRWQGNGNIMLMALGSQRRGWQRGMMGFLPSWGGKEGWANMVMMCGWVDGATEHRGNFKSGWWSRRERKRGRVTLLLPFMVSELSVSRLEEMRRNGTFFCLCYPRGLVQRWGAQRWRVSYE